MKLNYSKVIIHEIELFKSNYSKRIIMNIQEIIHLRYRIISLICEHQRAVKSVCLIRSSY